MPFLGDRLLYTTRKRRMSSYDGQKLAWFGGRESEERLATGNVKPRKPQGGMATFFWPIFVHICYRHTPVTLRNYEV